MRIVIGKKESSEKPAWEHLRTKRIRQSDIHFLRFLMILTLIATIYLGPAKYYILMQCQQESTGVLNETYIEEYRNPHVYKPNHILHLKIDDQWFQVLQNYSEKDIRNIKSELYSAEEKEVNITYVDTFIREPYLVQIQCEDENFLSSAYFEQCWKRDVITNGFHGVAVILVCIVIYLFRRGYIKVVRD